MMARAGPPPTLTADASAAYAERQQAVLANIRTAAGLAREPTTPTEWRRFGIAAFNLADEQCDDYMAAIRRVSIARRQAAQELNLVGTAATAIMGITEAAREAVAITATAFGLAQATSDNLASGVLYDLPPSTVRDLVRRLRAQYDATISENGDGPWADRPTAFRTIRGYIELCLPVVIEARIAASISGATPEVTSPPSPPGGTGAPPVVSVQAASVPSGPGLSQVLPPSPGGAPAPSRGSAAPSRPPTALVTPPPAPPPVARGAIPAAIQSRKAALVEFIRNQATPDQRKAVLAALKLPAAASDADAKKAIVRTVNTFVSDPATAALQMDALSTLLRPTLGNIPALGTIPPN